MQTTEQKIKYMKYHMDSIRFRIPIGHKNLYKKAAANAGLNLSQFFLKAAEEKMYREFGGDIFVYEVFSSTESGDSEILEI